MSTVTIEPLLHGYRRENLNHGHRTKILLKPNLLNYSFKSVSNAGWFCQFRKLHTIKASSSTSTDTALVETFDSGDVFFKESFPLKRTETVCNLVYFVSNDSVKLCLHSFVIFFSLVWDFGRWRERFL